MIYQHGESKIRGGSLSFMAEEWPLNVEVLIAMPIFLGFFIYEVCMVIHIQHLFLLHNRLLPPY